MADKQAKSYLQLMGEKGEPLVGQSEDPSHPHWLDVESLSFDPASTSLRCQRRHDIASLELAKAYRINRNFNKALLDMDSGSGVRSSVTLFGVSVSKIDLYFVGEKAMEGVTFEYKEMQMGRIAGNYVRTSSKAVKQKSVAPPIQFTSHVFRPRAAAPGLL